MMHRVRSRALPARFRRHRLLIVGCGDVGTRLVHSLQPVPRRVQVLALNSTPERSEALRAAGIRVLAGNLDEPSTLRRLAGLAQDEAEFLNDALIGFALCLIGIYVALAWIFSSWSRPLLIMAVIPFGLVGTIWGHAAWGMPLSMFSVIGLMVACVIL